MTRISTVRPKRKCFWRTRRSTACNGIWISPDPQKLWYNLSVSQSGFTFCLPCQWCEFSPCFYTFQTAWCRKPTFFPGSKAELPPLWTLLNRLHTLFLLSRQWMYFSLYLVCTWISWQPNSSSTIGEQIWMNHYIYTTKSKDPPWKPKLKSSACKLKRCLIWTPK